jgi:hypothetical protein
MKEAEEKGEFVGKYKTQLLTSLEAMYGIGEY